LELYTEHARGYVHSVNRYGDQERHRSNCIGQQALSISNLTEVPEQWGIQDKSCDEAWAIDARERRGAHMEQSIQDTLGKTKGKEEEDGGAVRKHRSQSAEGNCEHHSESVDSPPQLMRIARPRVLACPVCKAWSFFEKVKRSGQRKEPNRLTEGQTSQLGD
jgi:hypothetical protein